MEIDAITGDVKKGKVYKGELKELLTEDVLFEVGGELASSIIPGAGVGVVIGRELKKRRDKKKDAKTMQRSRKALENKKLAAPKPRKRRRIRLE